MSNPPAERVIAYVDGFNLYFGLRDSGLRRLYWLNVQALAASILRSGQQLVFTKYFTARLSGPRSAVSAEAARHFDGKRRRQSDFLDALQTLPDVRMFEGHFLGKDIQCKSCLTSWRSHEEKMTDVQIATEMLIDAFTDKFDTAILVSADSDLVPPTLAIRQFFPHKKIVVAFPPRRSSVELKRAANGWLHVGIDKLRRSQFPDQVKKADGFVLNRPESWR
jgi:uncharacterized LabA/DUF88 family protein